MGDATIDRTAGVASTLQRAVGDDRPLIPIRPGTTGLDTRCRAEALALGAVTFCGTQAARWAGAELVVDPGRVGANFRSYGHLRLDGEAFIGFDPLSGFFRAADGWVRTHANYDWHRERLLGVLGLDGTVDLDRAAVVAVVRERAAQELEDAVAVAGGIAVRVRDEAVFAAEVGTAPMLTWQPATPAAPVVGRPVRVLDLTRVIAGPVATRTLAALGMDVLRIDPPHLPESLPAHLDSAAGKRSAVVDLAEDQPTDHGAHPTGQRLAQELANSADVIVSGYRPGSLRRLGLDADDLAARHPDKIVATIQAWPAGSAWGGRRGFDSIVQAASGIAVREQADDGTPGALSAQALDHACGYALAGGILHALATGHGGRVATTLTGAAQALLSLGAGAPTAGAPSGETPDDTVHLETVETPLGVLRRARSMWEIPGVDATVRPLGSDHPAWSTP